MENLKKNLFKVVIAFIVFIAGLVILPSYSKADEPNTTGDLDIVLTVKGAFPDSDSSHRERNKSNFRSILLYQK